MWLLVLMLVCGHQLAYRLLGEREPICATASGSALVLVLFLTLVNGLAQWTSVQNSAWWAFGVLLLGIAVLIKVCPGESLSTTTLSTPMRHWLAAFLLFQFFFLNLIQNLWIDDDYWIHTPLQGLMAGSGVPPTHPFFADIVMNGHYGRDLLIVAICELTGGTVFRVQMVLTTALILICTALLTLSLRKHTDSDLAAFLGTSFLTMGINVGGRAGLLDTFQNNNALVALYVILLLHLFNELWATPREEVSRLRSRSLMAGLCLGNLAVVYETHFGLLVLVLICGTVALRILEPGRVRSFAYPALTLSVAFVMAASQGGPVTKLVKEKLSAPPATGSLSPGEMNQRQVVHLRFPKENLFEIQLGRGSYQRRSCAYEAYSSLSHLAEVSEETPYRSIWSWEVLQIHWLSTLLAPLSLLICFRNRSTLGLSFLAFGLISYLVPGVVNFGPIYEFEYFRWEFAAGFGFSVGLGVALAEAQRQARWPKATAVIIALLSVLNLYPFLALRPAMVGTDWKIRGYQSRLLWPLRASRWLQLHDFPLSFYQADLEVASYLSEHAQPGQRTLMSFPTHDKFSILCESTFVGLSGVRMVGHSLPLSYEIVGTPPFHMSAPARAYWSGQDPALLSHLGVEWLYLRWGSHFSQQTREAIANQQGITLVGAFPEQEPRGYLYRVQIPHRELPRSDELLDVDVTYRLRKEHPWLATSTAYQLDVEIHNQSESTLSAGNWIEISYSGSDDPRERMVATLAEELPPGQYNRQRLWYVTPHEAGQHTLEFRMESAGTLCPTRTRGPELRAELRGFRVMKQYAEVFQRLSIKLRKSSGTNR